MSSDEFMNIFRSAIELARFHLKKEYGIELAIEDLTAKLHAESGDISAFTYEPALESQKLGVPIKTLQKLAEELLRAKVFHLWVRVTCPNHADDLDNLIFETDDAAEFESKIEESCFHCGRIHDSPDWDCIQPVFGINRNLGDTDVFEECDFLAERPLVVD